MFMSRPLSTLALASTLMLAACADFGGPMNGSPDNLSPEERRLQAVETKLTDVSRRVDAMTRLTQGGGVNVNEELRALRGQIETLGFELDRAKQQQQKLYTDLDNRLSRLESGGGVGMAVPGGAGMPPGTGTSVPVQAGVGAPAAEAPAAPGEQQAYLQAFELLRSGKFDDALLGFQNQLANWPKGPMADDALYWMGEANYFKRDYPSALQNYQDLLSQFPQSERAADALLKVGFSQMEMKQTSAGKTTLQRVIRDYPDSTAAGLARQRLQQG